MRRSILKWEIAGIPFIVALGSLLHFAFDWSGQWRPMAIFAAVNESIWEHLKLAFWPGVFWAMLESRHLAIGAARLWATKGISLIVAAVTIVAVFESYTTILGGNNLVLDIGTFIVAVVAGQVVSTWLLVAGMHRAILRRAGQLLLIGQISAYATMTYFPPQLPLFMETRSGIYGIPILVKGPSGSFS